MSEHHMISETVVPYVCSQRDCEHWALGDAAQALPVLMMGAALGSPEAAAMAGQIVGQAISDALAPSFAALDRLRAER